MFKKLFVAAVVAIVSFTSYAQSVKIGSYDFQSIFNNMPETTVLETEISKRQTTAQTEITKMQSELQQKAQEFDEKVDSLDDVTKQLRYEELQTLNQRLQQYGQMQSQQIQQYSQQQQMLIHDKIIKAVKAVGDRDKYLMILPLQEEMYYSPTETTDVTAAIKKELGIK